MIDENHYEDAVKLAMLDAKRIQDFLWGADSATFQGFKPEVWMPLFQKRVNRIGAIDRSKANWKIETRKRLLQQASLSIQAILALNNDD